MDTVNFMSTKTPGIYRITNTLNGKVYVGSSDNTTKRMWVHRWMLRRGKHDNIMLQRTWDRDGESSFTFELLERVDDRAMLLIREQHWIDTLRSRSTDNGYNLCPVAGSRAGAIMPEGFSAKMSAINKGRVRSPETRAKMSASSIGRIKSDEHRQKLSDAATRQFADPAARERAREYGILGGGAFKGRKHTEQAKQAVSDKAIARNADPDFKAGWMEKVHKFTAEDRAKADLNKKGKAKKALRRFTDNQVLEIRADKMLMSYQALAAKYDADTGTMHSIVTGKTYADVLPVENPAG